MDNNNKVATLVERMPGQSPVDILKKALAEIESGEFLAKRAAIILVDQVGEDSFISVRFTDGVYNMEGALGLLELAKIEVAFKS